MDLKYEFLNLLEIFIFLSCRIRIQSIYTGSFNKPPPSPKKFSLIRGGGLLTPQKIFRGLRPRTPFSKVMQWYVCTYVFDILYYRQATGYHKLYKCHNCGIIPFWLVFFKEYQPKKYFGCLGAKPPGKKLVFWYVF